MRIDERIFKTLKFTIKCEKCGIIDIDFDDCFELENGLLVCESCCNKYLIDNY